MDDDDRTLADLENDIFCSEASSLLDRQLGRARMWIAQRKANGELANQYEFTRHCMKERSRRRHIIPAYCAAMWRLIHQEDR